MRIQNPVIYKQVPLTPQFKCKRNFTPTQDKFVPTQDEFVASYISKTLTDDRGRLKGIIYKTPLAISKVFKNMANPEDVFAKERFRSHLHPESEISRIAEALGGNKNIGSTLVKALIGFGAFAFAFETEQGNVLKITDGEHFPNGRKPADFDLPIIKSGKIRPNTGFYYFFEEKVSQDDLTDAEIRELINHAENQGYVMRDCTVNLVDTCSSDAILYHNQFGRARDGKVYLIDPGCALKIEDTKLAFFEKIMQKIRNL